METKAQVEENLFCEAAGVYQKHKGNETAMALKPRAFGDSVDEKGFL
jgi:hypothetical protein